MDDSLIRKSYVISCKYFPAPHNYETITEAFQLLYSKFGINPSSVTATVTDNGSNFVKAFRVYGRDSYEFTNFLEADDDEPEPIQYEEADRTKVFDVLNTAHGEAECINGDDDSEYEALIDLLHSDSSENVEEDEHETNYKNGSEEIFDFFKSRVISAQLDDQTAFALSNHLRCNAHKYNLVGSCDSLRALRNKQFSNMYESVFEKLNMLWYASGRQASSEIIIKYLGSNLTKPSNTRWNDIYLKVIHSKF